MKQKQLMYKIYKNIFIIRDSLPCVILRLIVGLKLLFDRKNKIE